MNTSLFEKIHALLLDTPKIDIHTHVTTNRLMARGLDDILLYHMVNSELYAAGAPDGNRVPDDRTEEEARHRIVSALPFLPRIRNTSLRWLIKVILKDLYGWNSDITMSNWEELHGLIKTANKDDNGRAREILNRINVKKIGTEITRKKESPSNDLFEFALEWAFFARNQWKQPDIALFELERAWNSDSIQAPIPVTMKMEDRPQLKKTIHSYADALEAVKHYCRHIPFDQISATAQGISTEINFGTFTEKEFNEALTKRNSAGPRERDIYASVIFNEFLSELEKSGNRIVFQFSMGAEPLPFESAMRLRQTTIGYLSEIIPSYPNLKFMCFNASRAGHQSLCTLVRELPNLSLAGYWWHGFFPGSLKQMMEERLDMVPLNKQCDYMSDAYCADWIYGKNKMICTQYAKVFTEKVESGQYDLVDVEHIAKAVFFDTPREILGFNVRSSGKDE